MTWSGAEEYSRSSEMGKRALTPALSRRERELVSEGALTPALSRRERGLVAERALTPALSRRVRELDSD
jgi:hypothetical protein